MIDLKKNVRKLLFDGKLINRVVVLFSTQGMMYEVAKILVTNDIKPYILNYVRRRDELHDIFPNISIEKLKKTSNVVLLITAEDYLHNRLFFEKTGLRVNEHIFINCELQGVAYIKWLVHDELRNWAITKKNNAFVLKKLLISFAYYSLGHNIAKKISKNKTAQMYLYDYTGMGDVFVLCLFLKQKEELLKGVDCILVVRNGICERIARLSGIKNVKCVTENQMKWLIYYARRPDWDNDNIHAITPFPNRIYTDIYSHYLYGKRINMADAYRCVMFDIVDKTVKYPIMEGNCERIEKLYSNTGVARGNTVIISPYANTVIGYPMKFWEAIANELLKAGFNVCTNVVGDEKEIPGTKRAMFAVEDAEMVVSQAGYFLGLRSGLCDVICNSSAYKCFIYPYYYIFNSSVYDFCSFKRMRLGVNYSEIRWGYDELGLLKKVVLKKFINARTARKILISDTE